MSEFLNDNQQVTNYDPVAEEAAKQAESKNSAPSSDNSSHLQKESASDRNWRQMREDNDRMKREADDLRKQLESKRGDDELVEYKQLREMQQRMEQQTLDLRLKSKFPDFDAVVNTQALQKLAAEDPELAYTLDNTPDMYAKAVSAYKMIKAKEPREPISEEDENFEENQYKPRSTNSLNQVERPLSGANAFQRGLTPEMKSKLYAEMQEAIKNR